MKNLDFLQELSIKISELVKQSPISDLDKNIHALIQGAFTKLELVSREEYDVQTEVLKQTRDKLERLEKKLEALEAQFKK
ncbi:MAG TPA: phosphoheptose isomerase [Methylophilaceae bacterium]|nr:phosphoheptose isomerase [Methylophilaceae bacterium]HAJ72239.1 phosphoheptose isomerase [Methylophilaceae bacterium]